MRVAGTPWANKGALKEKLMATGGGGTRPALSAREVRKNEEAAALATAESTERRLLQNLQTKPSGIAGRPRLKLTTSRPTPTTSLSTAAAAANDGEPLKASAGWSTRKINWADDNSDSD